MLTRTDPPKSGKIVTPPDPTRWSILPVDNPVLAVAALSVSKHRTHVSQGSATVIELAVVDRSNEKKRL